MRKLLFIVFALLFMSCTTSVESPWTGVDYTGYINEEGIGVTVTPPFWDMAVNLYQSWFK